MSVDQYNRRFSLSEERRYRQECPHPLPLVRVTADSEEVQVIVCRRCGRPELFTSRMGPIYPEKEQVKDLGEE